jgi:uncharacterized RDD family membrane protein YckC
MVENVFGPGEPLTIEQLGHDGWARYLARWLDNQLALIIAALLLGAVAMIAAREGHPQLVNLLVYNRVWGSIVGLSVVFLVGGVLEAFLLSVWGATPGKALMGVRVRDDHGRKLSFVTAFKRWFLVLIFGRALDFPVFAFIASWLSFARFKRVGSTPWDDDLELHVVRRQVNEWRWLIAVAVIGVAFFFSFRLLDVAFASARAAISGLR